MTPALVLGTASRAFKNGDNERYKVRYKPLCRLSVVGWYWMQQVAHSREFGVHMLVQHGGEAR